MQARGHILVRVALFAVFSLSLAAHSFAATREWTGAASTDWFENANWAGEQVPLAGDTVIIDGGTAVANEVSLWQDTPALASLTIIDAVMVFTNWDTTLFADDVTVGDGGILTHVTNSATEEVGGEWIPDARVNVECQNFTVEPGGSVNVDGKGYKGGPQNVSGTFGAGPGGTVYSHVSPSAGAGHGGRGGTTPILRAVGPFYGSVTEPVDPGSGSGGSNQNPGAPGGGVIRINASGQVTVNGILSAAGMYSTTGSRAGGGGSGGSIWIACNTFTGTGEVRADGGMGLSDVSGGGGGGRVAIHYDTSAQASLPLPSVTFTAHAGRGDAYHPVDEAPIFTFTGGREYYFHRSHESDWGSLYFSDASGVVAVTENLSGLAGYLKFGDGDPDFLLSSLTLDNAWLGLDSGGAITVSGDLDIGANAGLIGRHSETVISVGGNITVAGTMRFENIEKFECTGDLSLESSGEISFENVIDINIGGTVSLAESTVNMMLRGIDATVGGDLRVEGGAWLAAMGISTNGTVGDAGMRLDIKGDILLVDPDSYVYVFSDPDKGGSPFFICRDLSIDEGAGFIADSRGHRDEAGPGAGASGGAPSVGGGGGGGGYGGAGGDSESEKAGGGVYGDEMLPVDPGSGGGNCSNAPKGGDGGGLIRIRIKRKARINGILNANGEDGALGGTRRFPGGGAGGGIQLVIRDTLVRGENALITATGGHGGGVDLSDLYGGGGGGGRIAVWRYVSDDFYAEIMSGDFSRAVTDRIPVRLEGLCFVDGGLGYENGGDGTLIFGSPPPSGTMFIFY